MSAQAQPIISVGRVPSPPLLFRQSSPLFAPPPRSSLPSVSFPRTPKRRRQSGAPPAALRREKERKEGRKEGRKEKEGRRREKWQTLSCHEALDVFILPRAVLRERRIRRSARPSDFTKSFKFVRTVYETDVVKGCRLRAIIEDLT